MTFWQKKKKVPRWVWGGIIGVAAATLSLLLNIWCVSSSIPLNDELGMGCFLVFGILWVPPVLSYELLGISTVPESMFYTLGIILWFIIGSLIGAIISYMKKRTR